LVDPQGPGQVEDVETVRARVRTALADVGRVLPVMSGKGGVGKSAVCVSLALALARRGQRVGILDADLHGPSVAKMLGLRGQPVRVGPDERLRPVPGPLGIGVQSLDFFLEGNRAPDWDGEQAQGASLRSALEEAALADLLSRTAWGERETLLVDLPPGADRLPALARWLPGPRAALVVTIPSEVSLLAVERAIGRARAARVPLLGLVVNLTAAACAKCGAELPLHPEEPVARFAEDADLPIVARIPFDPALARAADAGGPWASEGVPVTPAERAVAGLAERLETLHHAAMERDAW
jgi:ATP-binding protein involved in chromosome partitioning